MIPRVIPFFLATLLLAIGPSLADDAPTTQPQLNYKPGVDQVMAMLRSPDTLDSAERIIRGFPEEALPIAKDDLSHQFSDLPANVGADVAAMIDRNHAARAHQTQLAAASDKWDEDCTRSAYQQVGSHNPAWDNDALLAILSFIKLNPDLDLFQKAQNEGCNDPLFIYFQLRAKQKISGQKDPDHLIPAADAVVNSNYPAIRKCFALVYAVQSTLFDTQPPIALTPDQVKQNLTRLNAALALFPSVCAEPNMPPRHLVEIIDLLQFDYWQCTGDRAKAVDTIFPVISAALPNSPIPLDFKGANYIALAWDARGSGWASTVTNDGARRMQDCLNTARQCLSDASKLDSFDDFAPLQMMSVVLGDGSGQAELDKWFTVATQANPDNTQPYTSRMCYLEPKWYGSYQAMIDFGHECVATQNYASGIPLQLADAHAAISQYFGTGYSLRPNRQYYHDNSAVWPDVCASYVPTLYLFPKDYYVRTLFARDATWCGQYQEAFHQFKLLGEHADPTVFTSPTQLAELRLEAQFQSAATQP